MCLVHTTNNLKKPCSQEVRLGADSCPCSITIGESLNLIYYFFPFVELYLTTNESFGVRLWDYYVKYREDKKQH